MTTSKKTLLVFTTLLGLIFIALAIFGSSGLIKNNQKAVQLTDIQTELDSKIEDSGIDIQKNEPVSQIKSFSDVDIDKMNGIFMPDYPISIRLAIILTVVLIFMSLPVVLLFKRTESDIYYENDVKKKKELDDKFINLGTQDGVRKMISIIKNNGVVIMPCDTIWGICSLADEKNKVRIQKIKERDENKNFITLCDIHTARNLIGSNCPNNIYEKWPAPLTVVAKKKLSKETIAVRVPDDKLLGKILAKTGAIYSTSVNKSGEEALNNFEQIKKKFASKVDAIGFNNSKKLTGVASTIIDITSVPFKIIREGSIKKKDLNL